MWIVKWFIGAILVVIIILFAMQNSSVMVSVRFWQWETAREMPLWIVMYVSFAAGMFFWLFISIFQMLGLKNENRQVRKELKKLRSELDRLRNVAVDDMIMPSTQANTENVKKLKSKKE